MDQTGIDPVQIAGWRLSVAHGAAERGQQKLAETSSLLSIAASLRQIAGLLDRTPLAPETLTLLPEPELVAGGCCCRQRENDADDLLEDAFGLVCNADNSITSGGHLKDDWERAALRFINGYNARLSSRYGTVSAEEEYAAGATSTLHASLAILERYATKCEDPSEAIAKTQQYLTKLLEQWGSGSAPAGVDWDQIKADARDELARLKAAETLAAEFDERSAD